MDENILDIDVRLDEIAAIKIAYNFIKNHPIQFHTSTTHTLIHSKVYFLHDSANPKIEQNAIIGSSNLTASGLRLYEYNSNKELNLLCDLKETTKERKAYFDTLLAQCRDFTNEERDLKHEAEAYTLYPFQLTTTRKIYKWLKTYGVALTDPVDSGKTLSALSLATLYKRITIISPSQAKNAVAHYKHNSQDLSILSQNIEFAPTMK